MMGPSEDELDERLDEAIEQALEGGRKDPKAGNAAFSAEVDQLLITASWLRTLADAPEPAGAAMAAGRRRMLEAAARKRQGTEVSVIARLGALVIQGLRWRIGHRVPAALVLGVVLAGLAAGSGAVVAANDSLPDSPLFAVKLATERVELLLAPDTRQREALVERFEERRREETVEMERRQQQPGRNWATATGTVAPPSGTPTRSPVPMPSVRRTATSPAERDEDPTRTPEPRSTPTPARTATRDTDDHETPEASRTPTAGRTQTPDDRVTRTPEATRTPDRDHDDDPTPSVTPWPSGTPRSDLTATPQLTPGQYGTPRAEMTPTAPRTPGSDRTPGIEAASVVTSAIGVDLAPTRMPDVDKGF